MANPTKHAESHVDHCLTEAQLEHVLRQEAPAGRVHAQTVELPIELGTVRCALYGPIMGDAPVEENSDVFYQRRGERKGESRMVVQPLRDVRTVTIVTGPHDGHECVLFTAYGGPEAPRERFDDDSDASAEFWRVHALAGW
jgi:hypothetical protein